VVSQRILEINLLIDGLSSFLFQIFFPLNFDSEVSIFFLFIASIIAIEEFGFNLKLFVKVILDAILLKRDYPLFICHKLGSQESF